MLGYCVTFTFTLSLALLVLPSTPVAAVTNQPNIVFVLADDYGSADIGYRYPQIKTPVLDQLAASGVKLDNYYVQPICTPTRSQLMTGKYQIHTGLQHSVLCPSQPNGLPLDSATLADKLRQTGYSTHMVGKWHLGFYKKEYLPINRGFDSFYGLYTGKEDHFTHAKPYPSKTTHYYLDLHNDREPVRDANGTYSTTLFTSKAIDVVNKHNKNKPLFLYLAYQAVHTPLQAPAKYTDLYKGIKDPKRRTYAGMVAALDEGIGNLTKVLKDRGLWDNTIFVFSTDNGAAHDKGGSNYPMRGAKDSLWEGGMRGVGFVAGGKLPSSQAGRVSNRMIHVSDWFPTLVSVAGGDLNGTKLDGVDQWETISRNAPSNRAVILHNIDPLTAPRGKRLYPDTFDNRYRAAIRVGDLKLITGNPGNGEWMMYPGNLTDSHTHPVVRHPVIEKDPTKNIWLFNITADPFEHRDLSHSQKDAVYFMLTKLAEFNKTAVPCRFPHKDPRSDPTLHGGVWGPWM